MIAVGREKEQTRIIAGAKERSCVLVIGARKSGRKTLLSGIREQFLNDLREATSLGAQYLPVWCDLSGLDHNSREQFYGYLWDCCQNKLRGRIPAAPSAAATADGCVSRPANLRGFIEGLNVLFERCTVDVRLVILLLGIRRILDSDWRCDFIEHLAYLAWGDQLPGRIHFVITGGKELYPETLRGTDFFAESAHFYLQNLERSVIQEMAGIHQCHDNELIDRIYRLTGGQAGLSEELLSRASTNGALTADSLEEAVAEFKETRARQLFAEWRDMLTPGMQPVHDLLGRKGRITRADANKVLEEEGELEPYLSPDWALKNLVIIGIAADCSPRGTYHEIERIGDLYWEYTGFEASGSELSPVPTETHTAGRRKDREKIFTQASTRSQYLGGGPYQYDWNNCSIVDGRGKEQSLPPEYSVVLEAMFTWRKDQHFRARVTELDYKTIGLLHLEAKLRGRKGGKQASEKAKFLHLLKSKDEDEFWKQKAETWKNSFRRFFETQLGLDFTGVIVKVRGQRKYKYGPTWGEKPTRYQSEIGSPKILKVDPDRFRDTQGDGGDSDTAL